MIIAVEVIQDFIVPVRRKRGGERECVCVRVQVGAHTCTQMYINTHV